MALFFSSLHINIYNIKVNREIGVNYLLHFFLNQENGTQSNNFIFFFIFANCIYIYLFISKYHLDLLKPQQIFALK